tara:strand:- start:171 stop:473 length:303 start_codon:yes stop_codon:yes gene_type:complete
MTNAAPKMIPTLDTRQMGETHKLGSVAAGLLANLQRRGNGRERSMAAITATMWGGRTSHCRADTLTLVRQLQALCKGTGVRMTVRNNPHVKGDYLVALKY